MASVWAFIAPAINMSAAKFCRSVRVNRSTLNHDSVTCSRSPEVSSIALHAQPLDLRIYTSIDVGFAIIGPFARQRRPPIQFLFIGSRVSSTLLSGLASRLIPCAFAITSPPSGCDEDFPLQAIDPARHTKNDGGQDCWPPLKIRVQCFSSLPKLGSDLNTAGGVIVVLQLQVIEAAVPHLVGQPSIPGVGAKAPRA